MGAKPKIKIFCPDGGECGLHAQVTESFEPPLSFGCLEGSQQIRGFGVQGLGCLRVGNATSILAGWLPQSRCKSRV